MAWQILSQLQGPQIDVNLFPNAMLAGTQASKINPGIAGAIGQGIQTGMSNYLDTYTGFQNIDLNEARIQQAEAQAAVAANAASPANLEQQNQYIKNRTRQSGALATSAETSATAGQQELASQTADLSTINATKRTARQVQQQQAEAQLAQLQGYNDVNEALKNDYTPTQDLENTFLGQQYSDVFRANPQIQLDGLNKLMKRAIQDGNNDLYNRAAAAYDDTLTTSSFKNDYKKNASRWTNDINTAVNSDLMNRIQPESLGYSREQALGVMKPIERGSIQMVGNSSVPKTDKNGNFIPVQGFLPGSKADTLYDVYMPDPRNPKVWHSVGTAREDQLKDINRGMTAASNMNGSALKLQLRRNQMNRQGAMQATHDQSQGFRGMPAAGPQSPAASPRQTAVQTAALQPSTSGIVDAARVQFQAGPQTMKEIEPQLKNIDKAIDEYQNDTSFRMSSLLPWGGFHAAKADADKIVDTIGSKRFEADESWQGKNGQDRLAEWNRRRDRLKNALPFSADRAQIDHAYPPFSTPKELYMYHQRTALFAQLDNVVKKRLDAAQKRRQQLLAPPNLNATFIQQNAQ